MTKVQHTKGPWIVTADASQCIQHVRSTNGAHIAEIGSARTDVDCIPEVQANARIIATAPELLAELIGLRNIVTYSRSNGIIAECRHCEGAAVPVESGKPIPHTKDCPISRAVAIIAKATGDIP